MCCEHQTVFQQWFERQQSQRAAHAYLLIAPEDTGGEQLVQAMAASLLCDTPTSAHHACGQCAACDLLAAFSHPDYRLLRPSIMNTAHPIEELRPEKPSKEITIDDIRALDNMVNQTSHRGGQRVVVVGHQKGREIKENLKRNFGCAHPEGARDTKFERNNG